MNSYSSYTVERGEIYWVSPGEYEKGGENTIKSNRPAIIVSSDEINGKKFNYEVVFLTTHPKRDEKTHVTIRSSNKTSTALCEQITTVSDEQVGNYIGTCTDEEMAMIDACLQLSLDLEAPAPASHTTSASTMVEPDPEDEEEFEGTEREELYNENQELIHENQELIHENQELYEKFLTARTEAGTLRRMYDELLEKTLQR